MNILSPLYIYIYIYIYIYMCVCVCVCVCVTFLHLSHSPSFGHPNNILWGLKTMKLPIIHFLLVCCYFFPHRLKYLNQHIKKGPGSKPSYVRYYEQCLHVQSPTHPQVQLLTGLLRALHYVAIHCRLWIVDGPLYEHHGYHVCKQQQ